MKLLAIFVALLFAQQSLALTSQEAIELGMTPLDEADVAKESFAPDIDHVVSLAKVVVVVDKSKRNTRNVDGQTAKVFVDGAFYSEYDVSTGTEEIRETTDGRRYIATTPFGIYRPTRAYTDYMSRAFLGAPMTWAIFFTGGIALHSTTRSHYYELGRRASGGCVRFRYEEAQEINELIVAQGEPHFRTVDQTEEVDGTLLKRVMYVNRDRFPTVERLTGRSLAERMWTYNSLIVVTGEN